MINIRDISIRCGSCMNYQTLTTYSKREEWNVYTYECDDTLCAAANARTIVEVPAEIDEFAQVHPESACGGSCAVR